MRSRRLFCAATIATLSLPLFAGGCGFFGAASGRSERGFRRSVADTEIRLTINDLWLKADEEMFRKVNLQVQEGRVLLSGNVRLPEQRLEAVRLAWQAPGVREVINEIEVSDSSSLTDAARDSWITTKLETTLLFDSRVSSTNYSIETVNQVVYLMGVAASQAELDRVIGHAKDISYVRRVISYVLQADDPARHS